MAQRSGEGLRRGLRGARLRCACTSAGRLASGLLLLSTSAVAAENDIQFWPVVTVNHALDDRWGVHLQTRFRMDEDVSRSKDFLVRPFVSWRPSESLTLDLGYDYLHSFPSASEHRIWQAVEHRAHWGNLTVKNRLRLDQRFVDDVDGAVVRLRYRLRGVHPIAGSRWYAAVSDEVLTNLNNQGSGPTSGFEQNRLRFALGGRFLERLHVESGYEWQYVESRSGPATHKHVFLIELSIDTPGRPPLPHSPR